VAVTPYQLETVLTSTPFLQRVAFALGAICQNVISESTGTALHAQRVRLAALVVNNVAQYVPEFAAQLVTQVTLASTNMVTVSGVANADIDTTDASLQTIISSIFNDFIT
jgi:hypothetical protein